MAASSHAKTDANVSAQQVVFQDEDTRADGKPLAFITGASSGIGVAFARKLAAEGYDLFLTARREKELSVMAAALRAKHDAAVDYLGADLSKEDDLKKLEKKIVELDRLDLLVNNAGFGVVGKFHEAALEKQIKMADVHVVAALRLLWTALGRMAPAKKGAIVNVSSLAALLPVNGSANYAATKAYLVTLTKTLKREYADDGVDFQALCPGFTYTEFHDTDEFEGFDRRDIPKMFWMSAEKVADASIKALRKRRTIVVPGFVNRLVAATLDNALGAAIISALGGKRRPNRAEKK
jgi:hypothetical protein